MIGATRYVAQAEISRQRQLSADIAKLQESVSTGKRLSAPSDDPVAAARIAAIRQDQADQAAWSRNVTIGAAVASAADIKLGSLGSLLDRAKDLMLQARNESTASSDRASIAAELNGIATEVTSYAAAADGNGNALFSDTTALAIPVSAAVTLTATDTKANVFGNVKTMAGTRSIVDILTAAAAAATSADPAARATAATASIADIDAAVDHLAAVRTDQGLRAQRFDDAQDRLTADGASATTERNDLEQTDTTYAIATYTAKDTQLKAAQAMFAQTHRQTLFDLLG